MNLDQLAIFVAVAEREHLTRGAAALRITPSTASAAIKALESSYNVHLFDRVGRGIELTRTGQTFLIEAKLTLASLKAAENVLTELGGLQSGTLDVLASQTIANYWLPARLMQFKSRYRGVEVSFSVGNTASVSQAVISGVAELGFIEGTINEVILHSVPLLADRLVIVMRADACPSPSDISPSQLDELEWIMREQGSGTRTEFEAALRAIGVDPTSLPVVLTLPTNEAILSAVRGSRCAAALSELVVQPFIASGALVALPIPLAPRQFTVLRHKERRPSAAARRFEELCRGES